MPAASIITALHNKEAYIAETIRSVLAQSMSDWEMIVVENGSSDNGPEVVRQFSDPRVRLVTSPKQGPGAARNFGLGLAAGEWILFLDADDLLEPDYLRERLSLTTSARQADILVGCWEEFPDGRPTEQLRHEPAAFRKDTGQVEAAAIAYAPWVLHAALVKRSRLTPAFFWPEEMDGLPSEDAAFWFPVFCGASILWSAIAGAIYRVATTGSRDEIRDVERHVRGVIGVIEHNLRFVEASGRVPTARQVATIVRALESSYRRALQNRNRGAAAMALRQAHSWLRRSPADGLSMWVRQLLGIRLFNLLRFGVI